MIIEVAGTPMPSQNTPWAWKSSTSNSPYIPINASDMMYEVKAKDNSRVVDLKHSHS